MKYIIDKYEIKDAKDSRTPMLSNDARTEDATTLFSYRECVGSILYLANKTRPDLSYASGYVSRYLDKQTKQDVINIKQIIRYIKGTSDLEITFRKTETNENVEKLNCYVDSDYAGDLESRKSTSDYIIYYSNGPIRLELKETAYSCIVKQNLLLQQIVLRN